MDNTCKICGKSFKLKKGLKRHLTVMHKCTFEDYIKKYEKRDSEKGVSKNRKNANNKGDDDKNVIDLQEYKEDKGQASAVQLLTEIEVERWGRLSAEQFSLL